MLDDFARSRARMGPSMRKSHPPSTMSLVALPTLGGQIHQQWILKSNAMYTT